MKINIFYPSKSPTKCEINISDLDTVEIIVDIIARIFEEDRNYCRLYFNLIFKNIILNDDDFVNFYQISNNDDLWFGKLENYFSHDDVIVEMFMTGWINENLYLIMKQGDNIGKIRSILNDIIRDGSNIIIWNVVGKLLHNDQIIDDIDLSGNYYKIIIKSNEDFNQSFEDCCDIHDQYLLSEYWWHGYCLVEEDPNVDKYDLEIMDQCSNEDEDDNDNDNDNNNNSSIDNVDQCDIQDDEDYEEDTYEEEEIDESCFEEEENMELSYEDDMRILIQDMGKHLLDFFLNCDEKLSNNWNEMPKCFLDSRFLFCKRMIARYVFIINGFWDSLAEIISSNYGLNKFYGFQKYFNLLINVAIIDYLDDARHERTLAGNNQSISTICQRAINEYLIDPNMSEKCLGKLFVNRFQLKSRLDNELDNLIQNDKLYVSVNLQMRGSAISFLQISTENMETILQLKKAISYKTKIPIPQLLLIDSRDDRKPMDEDLFDGNIDHDYVIEIVCNLENVDILHSIGSGCFGSVFLCKNRYSHKLFALKKPQQSIDLFREIQIQSQFRNSEILAQSEGIYLDDGRICIATEYMPGGSLSDHIKKKHNLPEQEIAKIALQILTQIKELHDNNIIHRDIKPDNIVLDQFGNAKLIDMGIAKNINQISQGQLKENLTRYQPGTIYYSAPEILDGDGYTEKIDIWSFGAIIVEMVTGRKPYHQLKPIQAAIKIRKNRKIEFTASQPMSEEFSQFINSCLKSDQRKRATAKKLIQSKFIFKSTLIKKHKKLNKLNI